MKNSLRPFLTVFAVGSLLLAQACSTAKVRILPGEDGTNRVTSRDIERDGAEEAALKEAYNFCDKQNKQMVVIKEDKTNYNGSMDEGTRKVVRNASKAAVVLAGPVGVIAKEATVGGAVGAAGMGGYAMTSDRDYEAGFTFRCK